MPVDESSFDFMATQFQGSGHTSALVKHAGGRSAAVRLLYAVTDTLGIARTDVVIFDHGLYLEIRMIEGLDDPAD